MSLQPTSSEMADFDERFKNLSPLLACLHEAAPSQDASIASTMFDADDAEWLSAAVSEGRELLKQNEPPWGVLGHKANRYFETTAEFRSWFSEMLDGIDGAVHPNHAA